ncbi:hypothetical protein ACFS27_28625 [Promicromonospora vindobonensis]|uniref:Uncharacterized protein n=1 Tax=Promicromonospora vindobonensis TaxID=195748 RepID=A0ABW5W231_9MICO
MSTRFSTGQVLSFLELTDTLTLEAEQAIVEWYDSGEAEMWDVTVAVGIS